MLYRPENFEEIKGHDKILRFARERIQQGTYPDCTLIISEEGLGKTSIAKVISKGLNCSSHFKPCDICSSCKEITEEVIRNNRTTNSVLTVKMTVKESVDKAAVIVQSLGKGFSDTGSKVIIIEEIQNMTDEAQDILLPYLEYIPNKVYVIACTTDTSKLQKSFLSRFVPIYLTRLSMRDMITVLKNEAYRRKLRIQGGDATYNMIASWAENKPRLALKVLEAMGEGNDVTMQDIKDFISFLDVGKIIPIISSFSGSILVGMQSVMDLSIDVNTHTMLIDILGEAVKFAMGQKSFRLSNEDMGLLREAVIDVNPDNLIQFLYEVASMRVFNKQGLLAAYLKAHPQRKAISEPNSDILSKELNTKFMLEPEPGISDESVRIPTLSELIMNGKKLDNN